MAKTLPSNSTMTVQVQVQVQFAKAQRRPLRWHQKTQESRCTLSA